MVVPAGMDLLLCAIEPDSGRHVPGRNCGMRCWPLSCVTLPPAGRAGLREDDLIVVVPTSAEDPLTGTARGLA
jgi:hypothetical protein